jgi:hypothetical protein
MNAKIPRIRTESLLGMLADFVNSYLRKTRDKQGVFYFILFAGSNNIDLKIV